MTAATNRRNRRAQARSRRRAGASWSARATRQRRADTYSDPLFLTAVDGPSGRLATYVYDSESKRRRIYEGAAFTTIVWDGWDYLQWRRPSGTHVFHTMNGEIVGESVGGTVRDYLLDPLGSVVATLDSGGLVDQFEYWPYGELVAEIEEGTAPFLWVGGLGYFRDSDLRTYIRAREYRQDLGSWMQLDPLWPSERAFQYVRNRPIRFADPSGLLDCEAECAKYKKANPNDVYPLTKSSGGVICVDGEKCPCYWGPDESGGIIAKCDIDCPKTGACRPPFKKGKDPDKEECIAYHNSVKCLDKHCPAGETPYGEWCHRNKCFICSQIKQYCGNVKFTPTPAVKEICKRCGITL